MPSTAGATDGTSRLGVDEIVQRLADGEKKRAGDLKGYTEQRSYSVSYRGFPASLSATIIVEATYDAPANKQFRILSQTGSKMLADHVLKKLLQAEEEAAQDPARPRPTTANYSFTLVNQQMVDGRPCYVLQVEPKTQSRLLYRGTIWVDEDDFARRENRKLSPARNPSFWIRATKIHHVNAKRTRILAAGNNQSETDVRWADEPLLPSIRRLQDGIRRRSPAEEQSADSGSGAITEVASASEARTILFDSPAGFFTPSVVAFGAGCSMACV